MFSLISQPRTIDVVSIMWPISVQFGNVFDVSEYGTLNTAQSETQTERHHRVGISSGDWSSAPSCRADRFLTSSGGGIELWPGSSRWSHKTAGGDGELLRAPSASPIRLQNGLECRCEAAGWYADAGSVQERSLAGPMTTMGESTGAAGRGRARPGEIREYTAN